MAIISNDIKIAIELLNQHNVVAIPTETVYGLAANAFNDVAVSKIFEAKNRPTFDPLIVHTHSIEQVRDFVLDIPPALLALAEAFWPGPLTLLLAKKKKISDLVTSGLDRVGVRIPNHALALQLLQQLNYPLAAPSANPFGYISPTNALHVQHQLGNKIPFILDGGFCKVGLESTIVGEENGNVIIYRLGGLTIKAIENVVGKVKIELNQSSNPTAPGQLISHYAPKKPLYIGNLNELEKQYHNNKIGILCFGDYKTKHITACVKNLSQTKNFTEAAINLFAYLRALDDMDVELIITEYLPTQLLGLAINDRLQRAASK